MLVQALLVSLWALVCGLDASTWQLGIYSPLVAGSVTGLILGDFTQGLILSSTFQLMFLGIVGIGAYVPPDTITGSILGVAFAILTNQGPVAAVAVALPVAVIMQQLGVLRMTFNITIMHKADKDALSGDFDKTANNHLLGLLTLVLFGFLPIFLALYIGVEYVTELFKFIPQGILDGLQVAGGLLPAVGFAMLLSLMMDKINWIFYILGFACTVYLNIPTMGVAVFAVILALLCDMFTGNSTTASAEDNKNRRDL